MNASGLKIISVVTTVVGLAVTAQQTLAGLGIKVDTNESTERALTVPVKDRDGFYKKFQIPAEFHERADQAFRQIADGIADLVTLVLTKGKIAPDDDFKSVKGE
jgi:hypothetical protein